jgi:hypothetical protein
LLAKPTWTNSQWVHPPKTLRLVQHEIHWTLLVFLVAQAEAVPLQLLQVLQQQAWVATRVEAFVNQPHCAV